MAHLPYGRGGSPLQNLIVRGHERTMISAIRCVEEMDAGPVYMKRELSLHGSAEEIYLRASRIIGQMMLEIVEEQPVPQPQQGRAVFFERRHPADSDLSQVTSLKEAYDLIRMLTPRVTHTPTSTLVHSGCSSGGCRNAATGCTLMCTSPFDIHQRDASGSPDVARCSVRART